jgi:RND family efflux transporter MFP subunit
MNLRPLLVIPPIVLGVVGFLWMTGGEAPPVVSRPEATLAVRVTEVAPQAVSATATGFGRVQAVREWAAVSEVEGRIVSLAEGLAEGTILDAGQVIAEVDQTDYELAAQRARANIAAAEAALAELDQQRENTERSLEIQTRILAVAQTEVDRATRLLDTGTGTQATLDNAQTGLLAQETALTSLQNTLALFDAQRASAEATLAVREAELAEAERDLGKTTIRAPFRGRVASVGIEADQFIRTGNHLITLQGAEAVEIVAEIQPNAFAPLIQTALGGVFDPGTEVDASRVIEFLNAAGVTATVRMDVAMFEASYAAEIVRFRGTIDDRTGTIGLVVRVANPMIANRERNEPPLSVGAFVSVELQAAPVEGLIAIPRAAVRQDDDGAAFVYLADADDRLALRPITTGPILDDRIVVTEGLAEGDRLVLSDPQPPVPGMALTPVTVTADGGL